MDYDFQTGGGYAIASLRGKPVAGIGPQQVHGTTTGLRQVLKENASALEEAKADIAGLWVAIVVMGLFSFAESPQTTTCFL